MSPFDGIVVRRLRDPGDTVTVGTTVLRLVAVDALWSRAWIDESSLGELQEGQVVRVRLGASGEPAHTGKVDRIGREVDRQTHELLVDVLLSEVPARVAMGQRADVWIETARRTDVLRVPLAFVRRDAAGAYCLVDRGGRVGRAAVTLGLDGRQLVEVTGLSAGDTVLDPLDAGSVEGRRWRAASP